MQLKQALKHKAEELHQQSLLKDLDAKRADLERKTALFVPSRQRLEKGGKTLELGEDYEAIKSLRELRAKNKIKQDVLRNNLTDARNNLQNADEALTIIESEHRDKLAEQSKLANLIQRVKTLDAQLVEAQDTVTRTRTEHQQSEQEFKDCCAKLEKDQTSLERTEVALREARKFLGQHSIDEKLTTGLAGIQKCFSMYQQADDKQSALRSSWSNAIQRKLQAQSILNDRAAMFSDVNHRYAVLEKNYARSKVFFESTLKGKTINEWREICDKSLKKLSELDELYEKFQKVRSLEEQLKTFQDIRLRIQQETRTLNIQDVEQAAWLHELEQEVARLEKRSALLHRIDDLEAVRELLQDGAAIPDPEEVNRQLAQTTQKLDELRETLASRQSRVAKLNEENSTVGRDEAELRKKINELSAEISTKVSLLGLKLSTGISPFEELDRERQRTRDTLQLARNAADTAESAEHDMKVAFDELEKIRERREEVTKIHQDALFAVQNARAEEEQFDTETKTQAEILASLKRELISQITPYGYKMLPDRNPSEVIETLAQRMKDWQEASRKSDQLERELSMASSKLTALKKEKESLRLKREELFSRVKAAEAARDSVQQQRIVLFASKNPDDEMSRMNADVESLRRQLNERREDRKEKAEELEKVQRALHTLETEMAKGREELQRLEINFNKRLLALGFRNEDDYSAACLTADERRTLQNELRELTQSDIELKAERDNTLARLLELQSDGQSLSNDEILAMIKEGPIDDEVRDLMLTCGFGDAHEA